MKSKEILPEEVRKAILKDIDMDERTFGFKPFYISPQTTSDILEALAASEADCEAKQAEGDLLEIARRQEKDLRLSCEKALEERNAEIDRLKENARVLTDNSKVNTNLLAENKRLREGMKNLLEPLEKRADAISLNTIGDYDKAVLLQNTMNNLQTLLTPKP